MVRRQEGQLGRSEVVRREDIVVVVGGIFFLCCGGLMGCPLVASMLLASFGRGGELAEMERASLAEDQTDGPRDAMRLKCMMYVV